METALPIEEIRGLYGSLLLLSKEQLQLLGNMSADRDISQEMMILFQKRQEVMEGIDSLLLDIEPEKDRTNNGSGKKRHTKFPLSLGKKQAEAHDQEI